MAGRRQQREEDRRLEQKRERELLLNYLQDEDDELWDDSEKTFAELRKVNEAKLDTRVPNHLKNDLLPKTVRHDRVTREVALNAKNMSQLSIEKAAEILYDQNRAAIVADTTYVDRNIFDPLMTPISDQKKAVTRRAVVGQKTSSLQSESLSQRDIDDVDPAFAPVKTNWKKTYKDDELSQQNPIRIARTSNDQYALKMRREEPEPEYPSFDDQNDLEDFGELAAELGFEGFEEKPVQVVKKNARSGLESLDARRLKARDAVTQSLRAGRQ